MKVVILGIDLEINIQTCINCKKNTGVGSFKSVYKDHYAILIICHICKRGIEKKVPFVNNTNANTKLMQIQRDSFIMRFCWNHGFDEMIQFRNIIK